MSRIIRPIDASKLNQIHTRIGHDQHTEKKIYIDINFTIIVKYIIIKWNECTQRMPLNCCKNCCKIKTIKKHHMHTVNIHYPNKEPVIMKCREWNKIWETILKSECKIWDTKRLNKVQHFLGKLRKNIQWRI